MPVLLAIETSQREGGVALRDAGGELHVEPLREERRHDDDLLAAIDRLVRGCELRPSDLEAVGISIGPGGFTGLRIAVATAKMLAETTGCALVAVPSALSVADAYGRQHDTDDGPVLVTLAAKRETFWGTRTRRVNGGSWSIEGQPGLIGPSTLSLEGLTAVVADRYLPEWAAQTCSNADVAVHAPRFDPRSTVAVAESMLEAGLTTDPLELRPLYPRPPEAVTLWEKKEGSGIRGLA